MPVRRWLSIVAPGLLVAATGVGAGDLLTASLAGSQVGLVAVVAAVVGGLLKWTLNEGIARWQLATGTTLVEGWIAWLPRGVQALFGVYFLLWTIMVGGALVNACGVAGAALVPLGDPVTSKMVWGVAHSLLGFALVRLGGFRWFEHAMSGCVVLLFVGVVLTALLLLPSQPDVVPGAALSTAFHSGSPWLLAVLGGVGGTVTLLSYGYWIRDTSRSGVAGLRVCQVDLGVAYVLTALFGASMVVIGSRIHLDGQGTGLALILADQLGAVLGPVGRWAFLLGFWSAVFSSLLGVWQSAPYMFADFFVDGRRSTRPASLMTRHAPGPALERTTAYRGYLGFITIASLPLLWFSLTAVQLAYAILGALFMPFLALTLLGLNARPSRVGAAFVNPPAINVLLVAIVALFLLIGALQLTGRMPSFGS